MRRRSGPLAGSTASAAAALVAALAAAGCTSGGGSATTGASVPAASTAAAPVASTATAAAAPTSAATGGASLQQEFVSTIRQVLPSVVEIKTTSGLGSGVIYDTDGHIVTNAHVVGTATTFQVSLSGSATALSAKLTGSYPPDDLAVIQVTGAAHLTPARFADSSKLQVGDIVLAMGNPLGLASSVTDGIVSAVGRTVSEGQGDGSPGATLPDA
ncbi:MAG TPA: trypsin-like peptidase domain-containing protein, partial [Trebonia sp.]|nr:trypsin-like peptidase domain-containing protein [Trebonia sp.]